MTDHSLAAIERRLAAMTPGPWVECNPGHSLEVCARTDESESQNGVSPVSTVVARACTAADCSAIAAAPTDLALLVEVAKAAMALLPLARDAWEHFEGEWAGSAHIDLLKAVEAAEAAVAPLRDEDPA